MREACIRASRSSAGIEGGANSTGRTSGVSESGVRMSKRGLLLSGALRRR